MMRLIATLAAVAATLSPTATGGNWVVMRTWSGGVCFLVPEVGRPAEDRLLFTTPDEKTACQSAARVKADEDMTGDQDHCVAYAIAMIDLCKAHGVTLPQ